jgi:hypothetical protein
MDLDARRAEIERGLREEFESGLPAIIEERVEKFEEELEEGLREEFEDGLDDKIDDEIERLLEESLEDETD